MVSPLAEGSQRARYTSTSTARLTVKQPSSVQPDTHSRRTPGMTATWARPKSVVGMDRRTGTSTVMEECTVWTHPLQSRICAVSGMLTRSTARQRDAEMISQSLGPLADTLMSAKGAVAPSGISCTHSVRSLTRWHRRPLPMMREVSTPPLITAGASGQRAEQEFLQQEPHPLQQEPAQPPQQPQLPLQEAPQPLAQPPVLHPLRQHELQQPFRQPELPQPHQPQFELQEFPQHQSSYHPQELRVHPSVRETELDLTM